MGCCSLGRGVCARVCVGVCASRCQLLSVPLVVTHGIMLLAPIICVRCGCNLITTLLLRDWSVAGGSHSSHLSSTHENGRGRSNSLSITGCWSGSATLKLLVRQTCVHALPAGQHLRPHQRWCSQAAANSKTHREQHRNSTETAPPVHLTQQQSSTNNPCECVLDMLRLPSY